MSAPGDHPPEAPRHETAAQFGARQAREGRRMRLGCGLVVGALVAVVVGIRMVERHGLVWLAALTAVAVAAAIAWTFARRDDADAFRVVDLFLRGPRRGVGWAALVFALLGVAAYRLFA
ncbi:MAG: hypothetical protein JNK75_04720 [Betaproteobacteria bacterium]|nr:hypothetical protein [Betaproteobacteria bacterium]